jgi:hypothetical protein
MTSTTSSATGQLLGYAEVSTEHQCRPTRSPSPV